MSEKLFLKQLAVQVRSGDGEERPSKLQLDVDLFQNKQLVVQLTDEQDLEFLYMLKIDEEYFQNLKVQQGIFIDFSWFPQMFVELLQLCLCEEAKDVPKYEVRLVVSGCNGADLSIVETNTSKRVWLLKFERGTDAEIKKHLADGLRTAKGKITELESTLLSTESGLGAALKQTKELLASRTAELEKLSLELKEVKAAHVQELAEERQRSLKVQSADQRQSETSSTATSQAPQAPCQCNPSRCKELGYSYVCGCLENNKKCLSTCNCEPCENPKGKEGQPAAGNTLSAQLDKMSINDRQAGSGQKD